MTARRSWALPGALALLAGLLMPLWPVPAGAHGGLTVLRTAAGPYQVVAQTSRVGDFIDEAISVTNTQSKRSVTAGTVVLTLRHASGEERGPFVAWAAAGIFEARYPPLADGDGWSVSITIEGPAGRVMVEHRYDVPAPEWRFASGAAAVVLNVAFVLVVLVLAPLVAYRRWFRPPPGQPSRLPPGDVPRLPGTN